MVFNEKKTSAKIGLNHPILTECADTDRQKQPQKYTVRRKQPENRGRHRETQSTTDRNKERHLIALVKVLGHKSQEFSCVLLAS